MDTRQSGAPRPTTSAKPGVEPDTQVSLTLTDIIRALGKDGPEEKRTRSTLARYLDDAETRTLLGASGPQRPTFPDASVAVFGALLEAHARGDLRPTKAAYWLTTNFPAVGVGEASGSDPTLAGRRAPQGDSALTGKPEIREPENGLGPISSQLLLRMTRSMEDFVEAVKDVAPVREDVAIDRHQAAVLLCCSPSSVGRFVRPIRRGVYRRSDVMRYIATGVRQVMS